MTAHDPTADDGQVSLRFVSVEALTGPARSVIRVQVRP
jgi:hypothetical protein